MKAAQRLEDQGRKIEEWTTLLSTLETEQEAFQGEIDVKIGREAIEGVKYTAYENDLSELDKYKAKIRRCRVTIDALQKTIPGLEREAKEERVIELEKQLSFIAKETDSFSGKAKEALNAHLKAKEECRDKYRKYAATRREYDDLRSELGNPVLLLNPRNKLKPPSRVLLDPSLLLRNESDFKYIFEGGLDSSYFIPQDEDI